MTANRFNLLDNMAAAGALEALEVQPQKRSPDGSVRFAVTLGEQGTILEVRSKHGLLRDPDIEPFAERLARLVAREMERGAPTLAEAVGRVGDKITDVLKMRAN